VFERFNAVNRDNRNVMLVTVDQFGVAFNVDFIKRIFVHMPRCRDDLFSFVAEMTTRTAVDYNTEFSWHLITAKTRTPKRLSNQDNRVNNNQAIFEEAFMSETNLDQAAAVALLNDILETELAGVVRYTHYALMVFGHSRIPIVSWLRSEATTCLAHANEAGELVTHFGEHPSLKIGSLLETHKHGINDILLESLDAEKKGLELYQRLLDLVRDRSVLLEEYARKMIAEEETHLGEVNKMLRKPGEITQFPTD
jgi:bacterioferritin